MFLRCLRDCVRMLSASDGVHIRPRSNLNRSRRGGSYRGKMTNRKISVASSKGGIGKTTVALGIARALADAGHRVLLVDMDFGNACLDILTGVENEVLYTVADIINGSCEPKEAVISLEQSGLYLLSAPAGGRESVTDKGALCRAVNSAAEAVEASFTVLDTGAGVNVCADAAFSVSDTVLVVAGHSPVSIRAAQSTAQRIADTAYAEVKLVINAFDTGNIIKVRRGHRTGMLDIIDNSGISLGGVVPYDYSLQLATEKAKCPRNEEAVCAFENIAARLCGESVPLFSGMKKIRKKKKVLFS